MSLAWRNRAIALAIAVTIYLLDQRVKNFVMQTLNLRKVGNIPLLPFFDLTWTQNFGVSLGMFEAQSVEMRWALVFFTAGIATIVFIWLLRETRFGDMFGLSLILGGAAGNIHDRYLYGFVVDYADFHIGSFRPFLIFNIADAAITIGVLIILARSLFLRDKAGDENSDMPAKDAAEI